MGKKIQHHEQDLQTRVNLFTLALMVPSLKKEKKWKHTSKSTNLTRRKKNDRKVIIQNTKVKNFRRKEISAVQIWKKSQDI